MLDNKYKMTKEENVFLAKRNIIDSIWKSANLEGIAVNFTETQAIYEGNNVAGLRVDEIITINNLKHAWMFTFSTIDDELNINYILSMHSFVGANLVDNAGKMRAYDVKMAGTEWKPELPTMDKLEKLIEQYEGTSSTEETLKFMCHLMKMQFFSDGNKRTFVLIANHELIKNGWGVLSIADKDKVEFGSLLIKYYEEEEQLENLVKFLYEKCIDGIETNKEE